MVFRIDSIFGAWYARAGWTLVVLLSLSLTACSGWGGEEPRSFEATNEDDAAFAEASDQPPTLRTLYSLARILRMQGKVSQSQYVYQRILSRAPEFLPAYSELAQVQLRADRVDEAIATLNKGLERAPSDAVLINNRGLCWVLKRDYRRALTDFQAATALSDREDFAANQAMTLGLLGRFDEAAVTYRTFLGEQETAHNLAILRGAAGGGQVERATIQTTVDGAGRTAPAAGAGG